MWPTPRPLPQPRWALGGSLADEVRTGHEGTQGVVWPANHCFCVVCSYTPPHLSTKYEMDSGPAAQALTLNSKIACSFRYTLPPQKCVFVTPISKNRRDGAMTHILKASPTDPAGALEMISCAPQRYRYEGPIRGVEGSRGQGIEGSRGRSIEGSKDRVQPDNEILIKLILWGV